MTDVAAAATIAVIGAGLAGAKAAEGARASGFEGRVVLVGDEDHAPYERPPLSKAVLRRGRTGLRPRSSRRLLRRPGHRDDDRPRRRIPRRRGSPSASRRRRDDRLRPGDHCHGYAQAAGRPGRRVGLGSTTCAPSTIRSACARRSARLAASPSWSRMDRVRSRRRRQRCGRRADRSRAHATSRCWGRTSARSSASCTGTTGPSSGWVSASSDYGAAKRVEQVVLTDGRLEAADAVVVGVGVLPRVGLAACAGSGSTTASWWTSTQSSQAGVFAAGDVAAARHHR